MKKVFGFLILTLGALLLLPSLFTSIGLISSIKTLVIRAINDEAGNNTEIWVQIAISAIYLVIAIFLLDNGFYYSGLTKRKKKRKRKAPVAQKQKGRIEK